MAKYLNETGLAHLIDKIKDGTLKAGAVDASGIDGIIPIEKLPKGAIERMYIAATDAARLALTKEDVQNGDTVKVTATGKMYFIVDDTKLAQGTTAASEDAFEEYIVGTANKVGHSLKVTVGNGSQQTFDGSSTVTIAVASKAQGDLADSSVQKIKITNNTDEYTPNSNGVVTLPPYPIVKKFATEINLSGGYAPAENAVPTAGGTVEAAIAALDGGKVDKVSGKGLSTNDYTTADKTKLAGIAEGATANTGTVTEIQVGDGLKLASGTAITTTGTIQVDADNSPTSNSKKLLTSGAIFSALNAIKTTKAGISTLGLIQVGAVDHTITPNRPTSVTGRTYPVVTSSDGHAFVNVPWVEDEAIATSDIDKMIAGTWEAA